MPADGPAVRNESGLLHSRCRVGPGGAGSLRVPVPAGTLPACAVGLVTAADASGRASASASWPGRSEPLRRGRWSGRRRLRCRWTRPAAATAPLPASPVPPSRRAIHRGPTERSARFRPSGRPSGRPAPCRPGRATTWRAVAPPTFPRGWGSGSRPGPADTRLQFPTSSWTHLPRPPGTAAARLVFTAGPFGSRPDLQPGQPREPPRPHSGQFWDCPYLTGGVAANAARRSTTIPTMLFGVEAPAVRPTRTRPVQREPAVGGGLRQLGHRLVRRGHRPMPDAGRRFEAIDVGDVVRRHAIGADPGEVAGVAAVVAADHQHQIDRLGVEQGQHRVLTLLRRAADGVEGPVALRQGVRRRTDRPSPCGASRRSRAIPTSAWSSGWPGRCARGRGRDRTPRDTALPNRAMKASRSPCLGCSRRPRRPPRDRARPGTGRPGSSAPGWPSPASPRA